ncbi:MAG: hypothetical protein ACKOW8_07945, partial [Flavobacteriales bacterium]
MLLPLFAWLFHDVIKRNFLVLVGLFISGVTLACIVCLWVAVNGSYSGGDIRNASVFISHIRFGLMLAMVMPLLYFSPEIPDAKKGLRISLIVALITLFLCFEIMTANLTGIVMMIAMLLYIALHYSIHNKTLWPRLILGLVLLILLSVFLYVKSEYTRYFTIRDADLQPMELKSEIGEPYLECSSPYIVEDGKVTERYIAFHEIDSAWNARTRISLDSRDGRGQQMRFTLIRYLTSLDYRKDANGIQRLSDNDVHNILDGSTNAYEQVRPAIINRMYALFYEWSVYKETGLVGGHSLFQRFEFWRAGWNIIRQNLWWGVGPGDIPAAFEMSYKENKSSLD